jgi:hypothetical protein
MRIQKFKKHLLIIFFISGFITSVSAQGNLPYVDQKPIHFGFSLGTSLMDFNVTAIPGDTAQVSSLTPTFSVGIITDLRLNRYFNLRFTPNLNLGGRDISFKFTNIETTSVQSFLLNMPFYLKYSSERKGNIRPYLITGGGVSFDLATTTDNTEILLRPVNFNVEFGVGCDLYFSFFKLCPELKYSIGLNDIFVPIKDWPTDPTDITKRSSPKNPIFSNALEKLKSNILTLTFNFE